MIFCGKYIFLSERTEKDLVEGINKQILKNIKVETHMIIIFKME